MRDCRKCDDRGRCTADDALACPYGKEERFRCLQYEGRAERHPGGDA